MLLVNSPLAVVGRPCKYHKEYILKSCSCGFLPLKGLNPGLTSETLTSAILGGWAVAWNCSAFPGCFLTSLGQRTALVQSLCPRYMSWDFHSSPDSAGIIFDRVLFHLPVRVQFYTPRNLTSLEVSNVLIFYPHGCFYIFHLEIWENLGYSWTCLHLHIWYWW